MDKVLVDKKIDETDKITSDEFRNSFENLKSILSPIENGFIKTIIDIYEKYGIEIIFDYFDGDTNSKYIKSNLNSVISNKIKTNPSKVVGLFTKTGSMVPDPNYRSTIRHPRTVKVHNIIDDGNGNISKESNTVTKSALNVNIPYEIHFLCISRKLTELIEFIYYTEVVYTKAMNLVTRVKGVEIPFTYTLKFEEISNSSIMSSDLNTNVYDISFSLMVGGVILNPFSLIDYKIGRQPLWNIELNTLGFYHNSDYLDKEREIEEPDSLLEEVPLLSYDKNAEYDKKDDYRENIDGSKITRIYNDRVEVLDKDIYSIYYSGYSISYQGNKSTTYKKDGNLTVEKDSNIISFIGKDKSYIKNNNKFTEIKDGSVVVKKDGFKFRKITDKHGNQLNEITNRSGTKFITKDSKFRLRDIDKNLHPDEIKDYYEKYNQDIEVWMTDTSLEINEDTSVLVFKI